MSESPAVEVRSLTRRYGETVALHDVSFDVGPGELFRMSFLWFVLAAVLVTVLLSRTNFGNWVRATGGFLPAAQSMGIPTTRVKIACFMICSVLAGFAGTIQVMRNDDVESPDASMPPAASASLPRRTLP